MASYRDEDLWTLVRSYDVSKLKELLASVGVPTTAVKEKLQQRLFHAVRLGLEILPTQAEEDKQVAAAHQKKLKLEDAGIVLPHPLTLDHWEAAPINFPDTTTRNIEDYFDKCNLEIGIKTKGVKALSEGHSLFLSKHVHDVAYHSVSHYLEVCYIGGYVIPQVRLTSDSYYVWARLSKKTGVVHTADCHCVAGLSGMCKHVAALLYHVAEEVRKGSNRACTSTLQKWHKPSQQLKKAAFVSDINTPKATKRVCPKKKARRDEYDPRPVEQRRQKQLQDFDLASLHAKSDGRPAALLYVRDLHANADHHREPDINHVVLDMEVGTSKLVPKIMDTLRGHNPGTCDSFVELLMFESDAQSQLAKDTTSQASSPLWHSHREGRLTASVMHDVVSHVHKAEVVGTITSVVKLVMGENTPFSSKATEHGKMNEPVARKEFSITMRKQHKNFSISETGLWVSMENPFIASSPDGLVNCACCGTGVVEIKCPYTDSLLSVFDYALKGTSHSQAQHKTVVIVENGQCVINKKHKYYTQMQVQMMCCEVSYCYLVIATQAEADNMRFFKVEKDEQLCSEIIRKAKIFYKQVIFEKLLEEL